MNYISEWCPGNTLGRISFVGHSLGFFILILFYFLNNKYIFINIGGLIIRAALPHLKKFEKKMFTFLTFSSPHCGFLFSSS